MSRLAPVERLRIAFELADLAERMQRARLRRRSPRDTRRDIERRIDAWYRRSGTDRGDAEGVSVPWPRLG